METTSLILDYLNLNQFRYKSKTKKNNLYTTQSVQGVLKSRFFCEQTFTSNDFTHQFASRNRIFSPRRDALATLFQLPNFIRTTRARCTLFSRYIIQSLCIRTKFTLVRKANTATATARHSNMRGWGSHPGGDICPIATPQR